MKILYAGQRDFLKFIKDFHRRGAAGFQTVEPAVRKILNQVKQKGDEALISLTERFEGWKATAQTLSVSRREIQAALQSIPPQDRKTLSLAARRIERFHRLQRERSWIFAEEDGNLLGQVIQPMGRVGIYVPGGKAAYPSSVLMNALPAKVAGVAEVIMTCPAPGGKINPAVLAAAHLCQVKKIFKVGGAQAIGAMAWGTPTIPKVDKIVGPGNIYVAAAKRLVFGEVAVDSIAGPSEIVIIADGTGEPAWLAADLISQAEHDEKASAVLLCWDPKFGQAVQREVFAQLASLPRRTTAAQSLRQYGAICVVRNWKEAIEIANQFAPEHLELAVSRPFRIVKRIKNAGAIFLGHFSPEAIGDYVAGPNHVLPTGGAARFSSPLGVYDFVKRSSLICLSPLGLRNLSTWAMRLARLEGLEGHLGSIARRTPRN